MWSTPASTARRRTVRAASRSAGGPKTPGPGSCMAPNPTRWTGRPARRTVWLGTAHTDPPDGRPANGRITGDSADRFRSGEEFHNHTGHGLGVGEDPEVAGSGQLHEPGSGDLL